jgi:hypothetical protein
VNQRIVSVLIALAIVAVAIDWLRGPARDEAGTSRPLTDAFDKQGSFNGDAGDRIYTIAIASGVTEQNVRRFARELEFSKGRSTEAYFYPEDAVIPLHGVSLASSVERAKAAIHETRGFSAWTYAFLRDPEGEIRFVDCQQTPEDAMCRKR